MSRRRKLFLFSLVLGATALYSLWRAPEWGARLLEHALSGYFHREVRVEDLAFRAVPAEIEIRGLRVAGPTPDAPPFLEIPSARIQPSLAPIRGNRIVLSRVRLEGLRLRIRGFANPPEGPGGDDIPRLGGGGGGGRGLSVGIERLVIVGGEFQLDHARVPLDLDLPGFRGRLEGRPEGGVAGHVSFGPGTMRFGGAPLMPLGTEIDLVIHRGLLTVEGGRLIGERMNLGWRGRLRLGRDPRGQFRLQGPVDLAVLERHVFRSGLGFAGTAEWNGLLSIDGPRLRIEGLAEGTGGQFRGAAVPRFRSWLSYDGTEGLVMRDLDLEAFGGKARLDVDVPPRSTGHPVHVRGTLAGVDGEGVLGMLFGWGRMGIGTAASGPVDVRWPKGRSRLVSGRMDLDLAGQADGRTPLSGRLEWSARDGVETWERADLKTPVMSGQVSGRVEADDGADLRVEGETSDLAATDDLFTRIRRGLGNAEAQLAGFSGRGSFRGRWVGTTSYPVFEGRFTGPGVRYANVDWGASEWAGRFDTAAESVESRSLVLRKGGAELWWDGRAEIGWYGLRDAVEGSVRLRRWPVADIVKFMNWDIEATGTLSGEAHVAGRRSDPRGEARVTARAGRYYGVAYDEAAISALFRDRVTEVTSGELKLGGGGISFRGRLTDDGVYDGTAEMREVDVGALVPARGAALAGRLSGPLSGHLLLQGTLTRPRLRASLSSPRVFFDDEGIGALEATLSGAGEGRLSVDARCRSGRVDLALEGSVGALPPYDARLRLVARDTSVDPFLRAVQPSLPGVVSLVASGEMRVFGPLASPAQLRVEAEAPDLRLLLPDYPIQAQEPVRLTLADGQLRLADFHLSGEGTDLAVTGGVDLLGDGPLAVSARGRADLRALSLVTRRLRATGAARLAVDLTGTRLDPHLVGTLELDGAGLRLRGFPHGVDGLTGRVRFTETAAELDGVSGSFAGGTLSLEGQASFSGGELRSYDIRPTGRGLSLRYPEGLRSLVDADLRLFGDAEKQWITGTIDVRQALYTRRYDVASELLGAGRRLAPPSPTSLEGGAQLDLQVRAPGTLRIDNNLATLTASADLAVQGTTRSPVVTGRAEIESGQVYFQGRTYIIQRGTLDFVNPRKLDPIFDIEGETQIRSYRVTLRVSGTLERVTPTLTSDPPLSSLQILALLAGQDESEVVNLTEAQARASQASLAAAGAATLAAGRLSEEVGLEREAERLFGLNRFSIDPSLLRGAGSTPTARVTVGKRLTPDLNVLYSQDLRGTEERILAVEYTLSDRFSLLLTRTDPGTAKTGVERGWAFDLRIRQSH